MTTGPAPGTDEGEKLGKYRLLKRLGIGGMAEVYLAETIGTAGFQKRLVVKRVLPELQANPSFIEMFLDEARLAAQLTHPNIAQTFDLGEADGSYFIAMEHVPGVTLRTLFKRLDEQGAEFPVGAALRVMAQLLEALDYAHGLADDGGRPLKIVHRDVTPANVMVTPQGGVKLLDFGIARAVTRQHRTQVGYTKGKFGFMAPEQVKGEEVDGRADLFAAGTVFYILLTGYAPFALKADSREDLRDMVEGRFIAPRIRRPGLSPRLEELLVKAMAKRREDRYPTAGAMLKDLEDYAAEARLSLGGRPLQELVKKTFPELFPAVPAPPAPELPPEPATDARATIDHAGATVDGRLGTGTGETMLDDEESSPAATTSPESTLSGADWLQRRPPPAAKAKRPAEPSSLKLVAAVAVGVVAVAAIGLAGMRVFREQVEPVAAPAPVVTTRPLPKARPDERPVVASVAAKPPEGVPVAAPVEEDLPDEPFSPRVKASPGKTASERPRATKNRAPEIAVPAPVEKVPTGTLRVTSVPSAIVRVGEREMGRTPLSFELPEGPCRLEFVFGGELGRKVQLVTVVAGRETPVSQSLDP
jgi:serine/threonine-protein kinase